MKNRKAGTIAILGLLGLASLLGAAPNNYSHIYYYGWFDGVWDRVDGHLGEPTLADQCANYSAASHYHPGRAQRDIFTSFWPHLEPYDSGNSATLDAHRGHIMNAGMKAVIVSYGRNGPPDLNRVGLIADRMTANSAFLRIAFAIRDYSGRTAAKVATDITQLLGKVATSKRYRVQYNTWVDARGAYRPVFYLYAAVQPCCDSNWGDYFLPDKQFRIDNSFIVLAMNATASDIEANGFDGTYNYTPGQRKSASFYLTRSDAAWAGFGPGEPWIFSAGVSPGYNTHRSKGDNKCKHRSQSAYNSELVDARSAQPHFISVVSFNEWGEGSQIEPARTNTNGMSGIVSPDRGPVYPNGFEYLGYKGNSSSYPNLYLDLTDAKIGPGTWLPRVQFPVQ